MSSMPLLRVTLQHGVKGCVQQAKGLCVEERGKNDGRNAHSWIRVDLAVAATTATAAAASATTPTMLIATSPSFISTV